MASNQQGGRFFAKAAHPKSGLFFGEMRGRDDARFHRKTAMDDAPSDMPSAAASAPTDMGGGGSDMGGGMYGTGKPKPKPKKSLGAPKVAGKTPDDWDADAGMPTGFHRPAQAQPEALEAGGQRFQSTEERAPDFGAASSRHGVVEGGSMKLPATSGHQMGKHASAVPRFMGTSYGLDKTATTAEEYVDRAKTYTKARAGEASKSLGTFGRGIASKSDEVVKGITQSPTTTAIAALVLGKMGLGAMKGVGRGVGRAVGRQPKARGAVGGALGYLRNLATGR